MIKKLTAWAKSALLLATLSVAMVPTVLSAQNSATPNSNVVYPIFFTATATGQTSAPISFGNASGAGNSFNMANLSVVGTSLTTVTFSVLGSPDGGVHYYALPVNALATPSTTATTITATSSGVYQVNVGGFTNIEVTTSGTFTATNVQFTITVSPSGTIARLGSGSGSSPFQTLSTTGTSGPAALNAGNLNIPNYSLSQVYPGAGYALSTGAAWGTSSAPGTLVPYAADSGAVNAYVVTMAPAVTAYVAGLEIAFKASAANTIAAPTINVNGLGAKTITRIGTAGLTGSSITTSAIVYLVYDGTEFQLLNDQAPNSKTVNFITFPSSITTNCVLAASSTTNFNCGTIVPAEYGTSETVASSATPTFSTAFRVSRNVLTANVTSFTLAAGSDGQEKCLDFTQGLGPFTVAPPSNVKGFFTVGVTNGDDNVQCFLYNTTRVAWVAESIGTINE